MSQEPAVWFPSIRAGTGADVFIQRLCEALVARGIRAEITWLPHRVEYLPLSVKVPHPPAWANVAHVNSWLPRRFWPQELPVAVTVHHLVHDPAYGPYRSQLQKAYHDLFIRHRELQAIRRADAVTTVSYYVRQTVSLFSGRDDITVIYNWADFEKYPISLHDGRRVEGTVRLLMAGSRSRRKGYDLLPELVKALGTGFEIRYAGGHVDDPVKIDGVIELGWLSEDALIHEYMMCDAVVSLSRYEGFGYTALEAMVCGKPFYGFATSALPEVVAPGCGVLVPIDDVSALATALHDFRARLDQSEGISPSASRSRALSHFSPRNVDRYIDIYQSLIASKGTD
ncbi:glycosyltransferase family 4 protein [Dyella sp. A6]|uniref:glycosyltransferase family 4 protein n=1 Tax=Dyella aluminiiresistens TaxID=3069105 RepID=UPI002E79110B|nr:glycosyltransferase family 4 protein [Dyella sp. A6]